MLPEPLRCLPSVKQPFLPQLQAEMGYTFAHPALLRVALTLPSWVNEHPQRGWPSHGVLEFFGDAVLGLLAADALWSKFPRAEEGTLTRLRTTVVSEDTLAELARECGLGMYLYLGKGEARAGGRTRNSALADTWEALLAAVFLDARHAGRDALAVSAHVFARLAAIPMASLHAETGLDPKTALQHWAQATHRATPRYIKEGERMDDSGRTLWQVRVQLTVVGGEPRVLGVGEGLSLKQAERTAAAGALAVLGAQGP